MKFPSDPSTSWHPGALGHTESAPAIIRHGNDPKAHLLNHVAYVLEPFGSEPIWSTLLGALLTHLRIVLCRIEGNICTIQLERAVWSRAEGDDRTVHLPKEWVLRLNPELNRIEFVNNTCEKPTGMLGAKKVFMLGLCKGAVQWFAYDQETQEMLTYCVTNVKIKPTDLHRASYSETVADWKTRVWQPEGE